MDLAAAELQANGVTVHKFYTPNNNWDAIKTAADGAHFLFYRGHGVYWSPMPTPAVGGFSLKNGFVSSNDIRNDLNLAPNAIIMLYSCFSAGSSSIDGGPISSAEARRRVAQYSDPFLDIGRKEKEPFALPRVPRQPQDLHAPQLPFPGVSPLQFHHLAVVPRVAQTNRVLAELCPLD